MTDEMHIHEFVAKADQLIDGQPVVVPMQVLEQLRNNIHLTNIITKTIGDGTEKQEVGDALRAFGLLIGMQAALQDGNTSKLAHYIKIVELTAIIAFCRDKGTLQILDTPLFDQPAGSA